MSCVTSWLDVCAHPVHAVCLLDAGEAPDGGCSVSLSQSGNSCHPQEMCPLSVCYHSLVQCQRGVLGAHPQTVAVKRPCKILSQTLTHTKGTQTKPQPFLSKKQDSPVLCGQSQGLKQWANPSASSFPHYYFFLCFVLIALTILELTVVHQAGLELRELTASYLQSAGVRVCTSMSGKSLVISKTADYQMRSNHRP